MAAGLLRLTAGWPMAVVVVGLLSFAGSAAIAADDASAVEAEPSIDERADRFRERCKLAEGQVIKRVPFENAEDRLAFYRLLSPGQADAIPDGPDVMYLRWVRGEVKGWGMSFGAPARLDGLLRMVAKLHPQEWEAEAELRELSLPGDFVYRPGAQQQALVDGMLAIMRDEFDVECKAEWREVERDAIVVAGDWNLTPLLSTTDAIHLFGASIDENRGGGGSGSLKEYFQAVGGWLDMPVVDEVNSPPDGELSWRYHHGFNGGAEERELAKNPDVVLTNLHLQTGLTYVVDNRKVRLLFIERVGDEGAAEEEAAED